MADEQKKKKVKGARKCEKLYKRKRGGFEARSRVPIIYNDWRYVSKDLKVMALDGVQATTSADITDSATETGSQLGREDFWLRGHTPGREPEGTDHALMEIRDRIVQLKEEVAAGTFLLEGHNDVLARALGTAEHPRWTRGVGSYVAYVAACYLRISDPADYIVAHGSVFPRAPGDVVHGVPLLPHQVKVAVTLVLPRMGEYPIPCPTEHIETVVDWEGSFVAWPKSLVGLGIVILNPEFMLYPEETELRMRPENIREFMRWEEVDQTIIIVFLRIIKRCNSRAITEFTRCCKKEHGFS
ncbi:unnamed protein product [Cuscuta campestris]|uniref:DUF8039 domain-containing protein n=1 Tax=Cuscuta campestris TaxID=132261 RepID=A0A484KVI7_9ASTE|nr:unnamed protein product [Cuscuta campestris]